MESMVAKITQIILSPILALIVGVFFLGLARKIMARIHWRYGPPLIQPVIDMIKLFYQKGVSHGRMFDLGIVLSLAGSVVVVLFLPFGQMCPLSSSGGLLVILYIMLLAPLGMALSGGQGANPNISIGISRKLILSLGYEVPLLLVLLAVMTRYKTISIVEVVSAQQSTSWSIISFPLFLSGLSYFLILPAILGIRPFDIASAPQEISSGPMAEYGGKYLALATIEHAFVLFISIALFVNLFLGGATNPVTFFVKMLVVFVLGLCVSAVFPRFRIEQAIKYLWKWPTLLAFVGLIITSGIRS
ncbi:MAG: NADH-quinone oxidoreductase subunit H [Sedimentisphaerales bacterium]|nr:NADH-quinone oxidoreductase subunit H [Sedimentisphaerales bacterium]